MEMLSDPKGKKSILPKADCRNTNDKEVPGTWAKLNVGWVKLNWDANYRENENRGGWGAILRNDTGQTVLTAWGSIDRCPSEWLKPSRAYKAILLVYVGSIYMENDCSSLITELMGDGSSKSDMS
jgi:hypothetical protein